MRYVIQYINKPKKSDNLPNTVVLEIESTITPLIPTLGSKFKYKHSFYIILSVDYFITSKGNITVIKIYMRGSLA